MLMFERDALLDLVEFGSDPRIGFITMSVQFCEGFEPFIGVAMIDEPSGGFGEEEN